MSSDLSAQQIIDSALKLPIAERTELLYALEQSLIDDAIDHGPSDPPEEVEAAWKDEIAKRLADIDSGRVKLLSSEEAWKIINGSKAPEA
jgi:putative addiction module component (TIGR02574 family)